MIAVGQQLGGYTVQRRIGGGQMGEVFLAQHRRIARRAAIKALLPELSDKESVIERFFKEARNTSLITHPGIIGILDCDIHEGQAYVVMDFLQGESLATYSKRNGTLESDMAFLLGVVAQVAGAVGAAHDAGIMHRGLKPENIYLHLASPADPTVSVKVLDFGVAQLSREDGGMSQTRSGILLGTPTYMSPEQCRGVGRIDARSDIYSLGCVLYEAICGRPPFVSRALGDVILAHVTEPPKPPTKLVHGGVLAKLNSLILKMLAKTPDERPQSMTEVLEALRICARAMDIDFEGALQPVTPVERPDYSAAAVSSPAGPAEANASGPTKPPPRPLQAPMPAWAVAPTPSQPSRPPIEPPSPVPSPPPPIEPPPPAPPAPHTPSIDPPRPPPSLDPPPPPSIDPPAPEEQPVRVISLADLMKGSQPSPSAPLPAFAPRTPRRVPKTMILGDEPLEPQIAAQLAAAQGQQVAAPSKGGSAGQVEPVAPGEATASPAKVDARDPLARLKALAGETMVLPQTGKGAQPDLRARGLAPVRPAEPPLPRALVGGTQVMPVVNAPIPGRQRAADYQEQADEGGEADEAEQDDSEAHRETEQLGSSRRAGSQRAAGPLSAHRPEGVLQAAARLWREQPRLILIVAAAVVLLGLVLAATVPMSGGGSSSSNARRPAAAGAPTGFVVPPSLPPPVRAPEPRPSGTPALPGVTPAAPKVAPETVRIDVHGIPPGTEVTVDGAPSALPVVVIRGKDSHRIGVRTPDGTQQSVDVDGTRDRVVELVLPQSDPPAVKEKVRAREPGGSEPSSRGKELPGRTGSAPQKKIPGARPKDLDAITDI
jgi:serine/threonine protein kinase